MHAALSVGHHRREYGLVAPQPRRAQAAGAAAALVTPVVDAASRRRLARCVNVADLRIAAEKRMHRMCFGYLDSGADDEATLRRSKDAFLEQELHYRVLAGTRPETLGAGDAHGLRPRCPSSREKPPRLFQLYVWKDRALVRRMLDLAASADFDHLAR
ncbi:very-long-chain-(S)-2-hydroxy-acid oxidase [Aureococcus anophagefferens]|nr:very-long-chain-(S)-2-hydroxy-acid oxidase [Aureococcus anophagefferens]